MHHDKFKDKTKRAEKDKLSSYGLSNSDYNISSNDNKTPTDENDFKIDFNSVLNDLNSIIGHDNLGQMDKNKVSSVNSPIVNTERLKDEPVSKSNHKSKLNKVKDGSSAPTINMSATQINNIQPYSNLFVSQPSFYMSNYNNDPFYSSYFAQYQDPKMMMNNYYFNNHCNVSSDNNPNYQLIQSKKVGYKENSSFIKTKNNLQSTQSTRSEIEYLLNNKRPAIVILSYKDSFSTNSMINQMSEEEINLLYNKIVDDIELVMSDINGNYFFQYFLERINKSQRLQIWTLLSFKSNFVKLLINDYANYCFQKLIEIGGGSDKDEQKIISSIISKRVDDLFHELKGAHILQKCIKYINLKYNKGLFNEISNKFIKLINDSKGVCVIKQLITTIKDIKELKNYFRNKIIKSLSDIILNRFGHYAIIHIIEEWNYDDFNFIVSFILKNITIILENSYSQSVLLKLVQANPNVR